MKQIIRTPLIGLASLVVLAISLLTLNVAQTAFAATDSGSVGLEGKVSAPPPTTAATITFPRDGSTITNLPTDVSGLCTNGLLVKIFKNNVFAGAVQCTNGSFSIKIDLFSGRNELVARVYDDLDQAGPDSNTVVVTFPFTGVSTGNRISLTSSFAKRGANPGQTLTWPITLTGGTGPYAVTVDWGDGSTPDIISQSFPGTFNITHKYANAGVYNVVVRATDKDGNIAFLQLVGVANGTVGQNNSANNGNSNGAEVTAVRTRVLWWPAASSVPLLFASFWIGKRYELQVLRRRLERREDIS